MTQSILYITYDGILEPLGQSQVLCYLVHLARTRPVILISFEKPENWRDIHRRELQRNETRAAGINWIPLVYHKSPTALSTAFDISHAAIVGAWTLMRYRVSVIHARSYVPSVVALLLKRTFNVKFVFDMRGFWADERVDGGLWPRAGQLFRLAKWFERRFLLSADCVVSLTQSAVSEMRTFTYLQQRTPRFAVITTCADLQLFKPHEDGPDHHQARQAFTIGYVGSVGLWYLFDQTLRCFKLLCDVIPDARLHILNRGDHKYIHDRLEAMSIDPAVVHLAATDHRGVAAAMRDFDAGIFFIKPLYSKIASAPTKLGEFLGCGVPCLGNTGVGDMASILETNQVGVALDRFDDVAMRGAIDRLLSLAHTPGIRRRCREVALRCFSLDEGVKRYAAIYEDLST